MAGYQSDTTVGVSEKVEGKIRVSKTAIIDIDNTLWQFCDAFYEELKKVNENFLP